MIFRLIFAPPKTKPDSVAQLVEQLTLNQWVESSSLSGVTENKAVVKYFTTAF